VIWVATSGTDQFGFRGYGRLLVDFALPATNRTALLPKRLSGRQVSSSRRYCDHGPLSGVVKGSSLGSTTKTASKLAGSFSLAFSLILWCEPGIS
jgi:hypothetical protein